jgi:hypothetical protein
MDWKEVERVRDALCVVEAQCLRMCRFFYSCYRTPSANAELANAAGEAVCQTNLFAMVRRG